MENSNKISHPILTIITPTTGKDRLFKLIESVDKQDIPFVHILLWDDKREGKFFYPDPKTFETLNPFKLSNALPNGSFRYSIVVPGSTVEGMAFGSSLRSIGMMAASTPYVCFADDDVWFEEGHFIELIKSIEGKEWAYCKRKIWSDENECLGIDDFESVGDSLNRKVPYEMVDNNCMIFKRRYGTSGAVLYRETNDYNDDRLFYAFLKKHAGIPGKSNTITNQICPRKLEAMFRENCTKA